MIKACIFDLDGTLADTLNSMAIAANEALKSVGLSELPVDNFKYYAGDGAKTLVERILTDAGDPGLVNFDIVYERYNARFKTDCTYKVTVYDGIYETLEGLKKRNIKLAVLSNKPHDRAVDVVNKLFGEDIFDIVWGQKASVPKKPAPDGALMIADAFGVQTDECMYIGDTNVDMQTGNAAHMYTVGVLWGFRSKAELEEHRAHHIAQNPKQLLDIVDMKNNGMIMDSPVKLVVSDVDGTLIKSGNKYLEDGFIDVVEKLLEKGIIFAVASGRQRISIESVFESCTKPLYMISENGGNIYYNGEDLCFHAFSKEEYAEIIEGVSRQIKEAYFVMAAPDAYYVEAGKPEWEDMLTNKYFFGIKVVDDIRKLEQPVCKVAIYVRGDLPAHAAHFRSLWGDRMEIAVSGDEWIDINPKGTNKGNGVKVLQQMFGVTPEETMVFGDNENDVSMMYSAKYSCAVENAVPAAKRAAAYETGSVLEELKKLL